MVLKVYYISLFPYNKYSESMQQFPSSDMKTSASSYFFKKKYHFYKIYNLWKKYVPTPYMTDQKKKKV